MLIKHNQELMLSAEETWSSIGESERYMYSVLRRGKDWGRERERECKSTRGGERRGHVMITIRAKWTLWLDVWRRTIYLLRGLRHTHTHSMMITPPPNGGHTRRHQSNRICMLISTQGIITTKTTHTRAHTGWRTKEGNRRKKEITTNVRKWIILTTSESSSNNSKKMIFWQK